MSALDVATLNLRNIADRWSERLPLLLADMAALQPDLMGLQECVFSVGQDRVLGAAGRGHYEIHQGWAGRPEYGNSALLRTPVTCAAGLAPERFDLGRNRSALLVPLKVDGLDLAFVVTHLHHVPADEDVREAQAKDLMAWLDGRAPGGTIVVGDFNAEPVEATYRVMVEAGFRSAFAEANGDEPAVTWPSGIQAPGMDVDGDPGCLDYIWLRGPIRATSCRLAFDRPAVDDPTLYPSDHLGLVARLELGG